MITLSYKNVSGIQKTYAFEGFLSASEDKKTIINTEWNGEQYAVQNVFYDNYYFEVFLRDDEYREFQKIQYAKDVLLQEQTSFTGKINKLSAEPYLNEFWKIKINIHSLDSKKIENIIKERDYGSFFIYYQNNNIEYKLNLPARKDFDLKRNIITDFKDNLSDYRKTSSSFKFRFYLTDTEIEDFFEQLRFVRYNSNEKIIYNGTDYYDYQITKKEVGSGLFQIDFIIFNYNKITTA